MTQHIKCKDYLLTSTPSLSLIPMCPTLEVILNFPNSICIMPNILQTFDSSHHGWNDHGAGRSQQKHLKQREF